MKIMLHSKNMELTPSIESWVSEKVSTLNKLLKSADQLAELRVEVGRPSKHHQKGQVYYAEINLKLGSNLFRAEAEYFDLRTAVDFVRDEIERQIKKFKSKRREITRQPKRI